jgi:cell division protein ZapA
MARDANIVQVEIFGQTYNLRADGDPAYVQNLAAWVDGKMREVARETKAVDTVRVAILTALNIADEHHKGLPASTAAPPAATAAEGELGRRAQEWVRILDEAIAG